MKYLGRHSIVETYGSPFAILDNVDGIEASLNEAVQVSGATPLSSNFQKFEPQGVSGVIIIAESHFTIHTWPELGYAAIDIFTCGSTIQQEPALAHLKQALEADEIVVKELGRGLIRTESGALMKGAQFARIK